MTQSVKLVLSSYGGRVKERFEGILKGSDHWNIDYQSQSLTELYRLESLVYLSSESPHTLSDLDPDKVYVIGGLVDRNRYKVSYFNVFFLNFYSNPNMLIESLLFLSLSTVIFMMFSIGSGINIFQSARNRNYYGSFADS